MNGRNIFSALIASLGGANTFVTALTAVVASIGTIFAAFNQMKIGRVEAELKNLEVSAQVEKSDREFADLFVKQVLTHEKVKNHEKNLQSLLALLEGVAHSNARGDKTATLDMRSLTPITLALLLGEPGGVAAMDKEYKHLNTWVTIALADNSQRTRLTAIQALAGICQRALRDGRLDVVDHAVTSINQLQRLLPEERDDPLKTRAAASAVRAQLGYFMREEDKLLTRAKLPKGVEGNENEMRTEIRDAFKETTDSTTSGDLQKQAIEVKQAVVQLKDSNDPKAETKTADLKATLDQINAALQTASQVKVDQVLSAHTGGRHHPRSGFVR